LPEADREIYKFIDEATDPKKLFTVGKVKRMVHEAKKQILDKIEENDYRTPSYDKKRTIFNEGSGQRLQSDKLVEIQHHYNKTITKSKVKGSNDPYFVGAYEAIVEHKVKGFIRVLEKKKMEVEDEDEEEEKKQSRE